MTSSENIEHIGIISHISDKLVKVSILPESACGNCRARGSCSIGDTNEKTLEVFCSSGENYSVGEQIKVVMEHSLGIKALGLGYLLPFLIVLVQLILLTALGINEGMAGLLSLAILVPYYITLSYFKESLKKEFSFRLKKL